MRIFRIPLEIIRLADSWHVNRLEILELVTGVSSNLGVIMIRSCGSSGGSSADLIC